MGFPTADSRSVTPFVATNWEAPSWRASAFLLSVEEKTTTSQPILLANWIARWPSPPTPITPTRSVERMPKERRTWKTVAPPHINGAASSGAIVSGILNM